MTNYNIPLRKSIRHVYYFAHINLKTISKLYLIIFNLAENSKHGARYIRLDKHQH